MAQRIQDEVSRAFARYVAAGGTLDGTTWHNAPASRIIEEFEAPLATIEEYAGGPVTCPDHPLCSECPRLIRLDYGAMARVTGASTVVLKG